MPHPQPLGSPVDGMEPLSRPRRARWYDEAAEGLVRPRRAEVEPLMGPLELDREFADEKLGSAPAQKGVWESRPMFDREPEVDSTPVPSALTEPTETWLVRHGHTFSYLGIFHFTLVLYFRPYELFPALAALSSLALVLAVATLAIYIPTQLTLEGNLTVRTVEVKLIVALTVAAVISIPLGISPAGSWATFTEIFIKAVLMFVVIINVSRTEVRLNGLLWLALTVGVMVGYNALDNYRNGVMGVDGYRVGGTGHGMFGNPNDMALHLVIMTPIAITLMLRAKYPWQKAIYGMCALLFVAGNMLTFSRAGFLGLAATMLVLAWKLGKGRRLIVMTALALCGVGFMAVAPGSYGFRILSIIIPSLDPVGSSQTREGHLIQSIWVTLRHPLTGIGMGNFGLMSNHGQVTHNAYTQVSSEIGILALIIYVGFILYPAWQLNRIEGETHGDRGASKYYYLSVGLQAAIAGYMVTSFFASVAYQWYIYYLVGYAVCLRRIYRTRTDSVAEVAPSVADLGRARPLSTAVTRPAV
jgi:O-antigen ligase